MNKKFHLLFLMLVIIAKCEVISADNPYCKAGDEGKNAASELEKADALFAKAHLAALTGGDSGKVCSDEVMANPLVKATDAVCAPTDDITDAALKLHEACGDTGAISLLKTCASAGLSVKDCLAEKKEDIDHVMGLTDKNLLCCVADIESTCTVGEGKCDADSATVILDKYDLKKLGVDATKKCGGFDNAVCKKGAKLPGNSNANGDPTTTPSNSSSLKPNVLLILLLPCILLFIYYFE